MTPANDTQNPMGGPGNPMGHGGSNQPFGRGGSNNSMGRGGPNNFNPVGRGGMSNPQMGGGGGGGPSNVPGNMDYPRGPNYEGYYVEGETDPEEFQNPFEEEPYNEESPFDDDLALYNHLIEEEEQKYNEVNILCNPFSGCFALLLDLLVYRSIRIRLNSELD